MERLPEEYRVDSDRCLQVAVFDLLTRKLLLEEVSVATLAEGGREDGDYIIYD